MSLDDHPDQLFDTATRLGLSLRETETGWLFTHEETGGELELKGDYNINEALQQGIDWAMHLQFPEISMMETSEMDE
ncbi:MAG: hypothetical protein F4117_04695 [Acidimicrobiales bacterium]|nr:hypothetical protein [Acidimicrobiaceae bacterium]MXV88576.1 hypothetical protein [Acidimicrobiales bacterium]MXX42592.1 hypothetical protein [Acidimicrobiales bacterium]MYA24927.1 hypothetical protein [Acidimicrobiales bacterium]MYB82732.1 hypothetical protein [Acidimicrobiales bacterium]